MVTGFYQQIQKLELHYTILHNWLWEWQGQNVIQNYKCTLSAFTKLKTSLVLIAFP